MFIKFRGFDQSFQQLATAALTSRTSKKNFDSKKALKDKKVRHEADPSNASILLVVLLPPPRAENLARDRSLSCDRPDNFLF